MTSSMLYCDRRMGGIERWVVGDPREANMRVPDDLKESVCFLCIQDTRSGEPIYRYGGTAFFVSVPSEQVDGTDSKYRYIVTARHNIEKAQEHGALFVRLNKRNGGSEFIEINSEWIFPDNSADVAVTTNHFDASVYDIKSIPLAMFGSDETIKQYSIGIGDELVVIGLFTERHGRQRNIPIARSGIIASMPDEPLQDNRTGIDYDAYLAEVRSIGGLSGSPVFVYLEPIRPQMCLKSAFFLFGLIRGHWDFQNRSAVMDFGADELKAVNMGIAIVTPIQQLANLLYDPALVKERRAMDRKRAQEHAPTLDSAFTDDTSHTDRFLSAVKGLATTPKIEFDKAEEKRKADKK